MLQRLISLSVKNRLIVLAVASFLLAAGVYAFRNIPVEAFPDVNDTQVVIITQVPGSAPEEVEKLVTLPIEREMNGIPHMSGQYSRTMFGLSQVTLIFEDGVSDYFARAQVLEHLQNVTLPTGIQASIAPLENSLGEVYRYVLEAPPGTPTYEIKAVQDWVCLPAFKTVPGVVDVNGYGGGFKQIHVDVDPKRLKDYGISIPQLSQAVANNNANVGGSVLTHGQEEYTVRSLGLVKNLDDVRHVVLAERNGTPVLVQDVAQVGLGTAVRRSSTSFNRADDVVEGVVLMRIGENPTRVCAGIRDKVDELNHGLLPPGYHLNPFYDRTELVQHTVHTVVHNLVFGGILVAAVLMLFLGNFRSAIIVAAVIPLALAFGFLMLFIKGVPANLISLGAVDFGVLIDGAVVMVEAILVRFLLLQEQGLLEKRDERDAWIRNVGSEMGRPIVFSKAIIIVALLPIFTFQRVEGRIFAPMALTLGFALLGSLLLFLTFVPALSSYLLTSKLQQRQNPLMRVLHRVYDPLLARLVRHPRRAVAAAAVLLVVALGLATRLGTEFLPRLDEGNIWLTATFPLSVSLEEAQALERQVRSVLRAFPEVTTVLGQLGRSDDGTDAKGINHVEYGVDLAPKDHWRSQFHADKDRLIAAMNDRLKQIPGVTYNFSQVIEDNVEEALSGIKGDLAIKLFGPDMQVLQEKGQAIASVIRQVPGAADVDVEQVAGLPQLILEADRARLARYGLNVSDLQGYVQTAIGGQAVSQYLDGERRFDISVRLQAGDRDRIDQLSDLTIPSPDGFQVPMAQLASFSVQPGAMMIFRERNSRMMPIHCMIRGRDQGSVVQDAQALVAQKIKLPPGYQLKWEGQFENQRRAMARLAIIVPISLGLILVLLFWMFKSLRDALLVLCNVPFALIGGILSLLLTHLPLSVSAAVGFIALFGIATEDGVILVSQFRRLRAQGMPMDEAILKGAKSRLRPVIMTALLAALGLLPMAVSSGIGSEVQKPLATVVIGGLATATLLTLLVLPTMYKLLGAAVEVTGKATKRFYSGPLQ
jgi:cobalt-zinc-cadmium resistance protein CzcA